MTFFKSKEQPKPHSTLAKTFHWGFGGLFLYAISKGLDDVSQLADPALWQFEMVFAGVFLALLVGRFIFMAKTRPTALAPSTPKWMKRAARAGHLAIYISVGMIAVSGLMIGGLYALGFTSGALLASAIALHEFTITAAYASIGLHIAAALFHAVIGDGIWSAMVPIKRRV